MNLYFNGVPLGLGSCKNQTFSEEEMLVGTWVDGKPIYRKVFYIDGIKAKKDQMILENAIPNLDAIIDYHGIGCNSVGWVNFSWNDGIVYLYFTANGDIKSHDVHDSWINVPFYIIVEYTKTTDFGGTT